MEDIRDEIFAKLKGRKVTAVIYTDMDGVIAGMENALKTAEEIGVNVEGCAADGDEVYAGDMIMEITGSAKQITMAEDMIIAAVSKTSGVATAARRFAEAAGNDIKVVGGAWKKMPRAIKQDLRHAALVGGVGVHMIDEPMVYLDKNYVEMLGGIQKTLLAVSGMKDRKKVIQIKGRYEHGDIVREAHTAVASGADIICVDTGNIEDLKRVTSALRPELQSLEKQEAYRKVRFAFGGGVTVEDLPALKEAGADIVDVGRSIVDAPLLDLRLEVRNVEKSSYEHAGYDLLDKNELKIEGIVLHDTNLTTLAEIVAREIGVDTEDVLVIDVRDGVVALDILKRQLDPEKFISKEETILREISKLKGVKLMKGARITSNGMLGWIAGDEEGIEDGIAGIQRANDLGKQILENVRRRVIVFPTGSEVESGEIEDTNTPLIISKFTEAGFNVTKGEILKDDITLFTARLRQAAEAGFGICITTGGVGVENKDFSVEAIEELDPDAAAPYIARFRQGHGRHSKDGIRIGVGQYGVTTFIALPGPNDEVSLVIDTVVKGMQEGWSKELLAAAIARLLRNRLKEKIGVMMHEHVHHHGTHENM